MFFIFFFFLSVLAVEITLNMFGQPVRTYFRILQAGENFFGAEYDTFGGTDYSFTRLTLASGGMGKFLFLLYFFFKVITKHTKTPFFYFFFFLKRISPLYNNSV